jgi:NTE family protein
MIDGKKVTVVLGGGGMKGLAHIGALKALHRHGIEPDEYVGTSVGALIAALAAGGMPLPQIEETALSIGKKDILDYNWLGLLWKRGRARSLYRGKAFHDFVRRILPVDSFDALVKPLFITSVELDSGLETVWGMPGFREVPIHDAVVASCSIPGIYPPKKIGRHHFIDGSLVDTLPVKVAVYSKADHILAIYLEPSEMTQRGTALRGVAAILEQSQSILSRTLVRHNLHYFDKAPITLIQPNVGMFGFFDFDHHAAVIRAGEESTERALRLHPVFGPRIRDERPAPAPPRLADLTPDSLPGRA